MAARMVPRGEIAMPLGSRSAMLRRMVMGLIPTLVMNWKPRIRRLMSSACWLAGLLPPNATWT